MIQFTMGQAPGFLPQLIQNLSGVFFRESGSEPFGEHIAQALLLLVDGERLGQPVSGRVSGTHPIHRLQRPLGGYVFGHALQCFVDNRPRRKPIAPRLPNNGQRFTHLIRFEPVSLHGMDQLKGVVGRDSRLNELPDFCRQRVGKLLQSPLNRIGGLGRQWQECGF